MNIKRAFLAAAAVLMVPSLAMAQSTVTFPTTVDFTNDFDGTVNVELTCNSGNPLVQDFDISEGAGVTFSVSNITAGAACSIALSGLETGYVDATDPACEFTMADQAEYPCDLVIEPEVSLITYTVTFEGQGTDDPTIDLGWELLLNCDSVSPDTGPNFNPVGIFTSGTGDAGPAPTLFAGWYPNPDGGTSCEIEFTTVGSAVEAGPSCEFDLEVGDEGFDCDMTAAVFFEGIPTLSQYGMAIMILLMLGVGFVGFRRFV